MLDRSPDDLRPHGMAARTPKFALLIALAVRSGPLLHALITVVASGARGAGCAARDTPPPGGVRRREHNLSAILPGILSIWFMTKRRARLFDLLQLYSIFSSSNGQTCTCTCCNGATGTARSSPWLVCASATQQQQHPPPCEPPRGWRRPRCVAPGPAIMHGRSPSTRQLPPRLAGSVHH